MNVQGEKSSKKYSSISLMLILIVVMLAMTACSNAGSADEDIYSFQLHGIDESILESSQVGKPLFVSFWATWCPYCKEEMPIFESLYKEFGDQIEFAAVDLIELDSMKSVKSYIEEHQYTMPMYLDYDGIVSNIFRVNSTPTVIILDRNGKLAHMKLGAGGDDSEENYRTLLAAMLEND